MPNDTAPTIDIEKTVDIAAPPERVWRALTDHREFGAWFGVHLDGPFAPGQVATGRMTNPRFKDAPWRATIGEIAPERRLFSFTWHPYAVDPEMDYSREEPTLVEFTLEPIPTGTRLTVRESGFDRLPPHRRDEALRMNEGGWEYQVKNIAEHAERRP